MAYCDTVTDALTVQASKIGVEDGNENLNSFSYLMQATGAISGALMAMMVSNTDKIGPFQCFGIYLVLQSIFFFAALFMNKKLEPGPISNIKSEIEPPTNENQGPNIPDDDVEQRIFILDQEENAPAPEEMSRFQTLKLNISLIWVALRHKEIYNCLLFFMATGLILPQFEDVQYYFLLNKCGVT